MKNKVLVLDIASVFLEFSVQSKMLQKKSASLLLPKWAGFRNRLDLFSVHFVFFLKQSAH